MRAWILRLLWGMGALVLSLRYKITAVGTRRVPDEGALLLLGNHVSWLDWMLVQIPLRRRLRFMMARSIYEWRALNWMFRLGRTIPVSPKASKGAFDEAITALNNGDAIVIFPEGGITKSGEIEKFYRGFEIIASKSRAGTIVPFYIDGMCGSRWSYAPQDRAVNPTGFRRRVTVVYGRPMPINSTAEAVRKTVMHIKDSSAQ
jgi:acyl-[acyl-carrier-protein]-phospholipid O-acyltransferase/long-chain-fatty-acid--[acyl-carrier-protein] ligase